MLRTRTRTDATGARGLGRLVEADSHLLAPHLQPWSKVVVHDDDRTVSVSWARDAAVGLHSVVIDYARDSVRIGTKMGTRPAFQGRTGYVVLRMIIEHTTVRLREPLHGRRVEMLGTTLTRSE